MEERRFKKGDVVIRQGDDGDELYLVDEGTLNCSKIFPGDTKETFLLEYQPSSAFGEQAQTQN